MVIDFVVPYVDNQDEVWRKVFIDYCKRTNNYIKIAELNTCRYKDNVCLIDYLIKLVNKNMPFIRTIHLLLSNKEQAPKDLPSNVEIHLHKDFIPSKFLPTFNSTTIEMFLWNIPNLSEHFIYSNDDMIPLHELSEDDFFENDKVKVKWYEETLKDNNAEFRRQCFNSYKSVCECLKLPHNNYDYIRPEHSMTPMIRSHCEECYKLIEKQVVPYISALRTGMNHNQYVFPIYEYLKYGTLPCNINFHYEKRSDEVDTNYQIACFNIVPPEKAPILIKELDKLCE